MLRIGFLETLPSSPTAHCAAVGCNVRDYSRLCLASTKPRIKFPNVAEQKCLAANKLHFRRLRGIRSNRVGKYIAIFAILSEISKRHPWIRRPQDTRCSTKIRPFSIIVGNAIRTCTRLHFLSEVPRDLTANGGSEPDENPNSERISEEKREDETQRRVVRRIHHAGISGPIWRARKLSHVLSQSEPNGVALMNGFLREERLNSRVTVLPGIPSRARRSDFARSAGEQRA